MKRRLRLVLAPAVLLGASPPKPWSAPSEWKAKTPPFAVTDAQIKAGEAVFRQI